MSVGAGMVDGSVSPPTTTPATKLQQLSETPLWAIIAVAVGSLLSVGGGVAVSVGAGLVGAREFSSTNRLRCHRFSMGGC